MWDVWGIRPPEQGEDYKQEVCLMGWESVGHFRMLDAR
jgi:hypothetical protein